MKNSTLIVALSMTILVVASVAVLAFLQMPLTPQISQRSTATAISNCPPRPTRTPVSTPTPMRDTPKPPTPAPTPTPGAPRIGTPVSVPTLVHPIETEEEALVVAFDIDMRGVNWDDPWCLETPRLQPGRITVKWYPNETAYNGSSSPIEYGGADPIWVVTIKGSVNLRPMPHVECKKDIHYIINQKTGQLVGMGCSALP